jgi:hypothetical protein
MALLHYSSCPSKMKDTGSGILNANINPISENTREKGEKKW